MDDLTTPAKAEPGGADLNEVPTDAAVMIISLLPLPPADLPAHTEDKLIHIFPRRIRPRKQHT